MTISRRVFLALALLLPAISIGCASTGTGSSSDRGSSNVLTREQILEMEATNLYDVIRRLRPRWLQVRAQRSFDMQTEIAVIQDDIYQGPAELLKELAPELAYRIEYMDGARASAMYGSLMTGRHIEAALLISTRPIG